MSRRTRNEWISAAVLGSRRSRRATFVGSSYGRRLRVERLESRYLLAGDLLNSLALVDSSLSPDNGGDAEGIVLTSPAVPPEFDLSTASGAEETVAAAAFALDQTFLLHSNPGATKVIYLDFDGHTTSGMTWNTNYNDGADFTTPAYSYQGDSTFSDAELQRIQNIWERVKEDFIPFDVDVTTEDPGVDALRKSGLGDTHWGIRVVIGGNSNDWYGSSAGGVASVGSFDTSTDRPCYVFTENLSNGNEKYTAEAISHEAGHTLDLSHDGTSGTGGVTYYEGHGSGATGWAPIMGVGYYEQLSQWSKGEYPAANQTQDDLSRITTRNGFGYRTDDHGGTTGTATPLSITSTVVFNEGIIERTTDLDYFSFSTIGGIINLDIDPFYRSPNLDILATLYNSSGSIIATSNPVLALDANFSMVLGPGTYYVSIDGTGKPADGTDFGYSDYGSLGYYSISGTIVDTASLGVELYGTSFATSPFSLFVAAGFIDASFSLENNGTTTAPAFDVKFYLSDDATIDPATDLLLTLDPASVYFDPSEPSAYHVPGGLATFGTHSQTVRLTTPINDPFETDNQYFVGMFVDADGNAAESNETNNRNRGLGVDKQQVTYALAVSNSTSIASPASGIGNPYPSSIVISGVVGTISDVNVSLFGITHTNPDDFDILLVGPAGQKVIILSDIGGAGDISGVNLVLDDQAANFLPDSLQLISGAYKLTNIGSGDLFTAPAPAGPYASLLSAFNGTDPNGTWSLYVLDDGPSNSGSIAGGWGLTFAVNSAPTNPTNVPLAAIDEDTPSAGNAGSLVGSIVSATGTTDADGDALGIAVTSVDNSHGQWQYSTNGGGNWQDIALATLTAAQLLGPTDYVRFVSGADFNSQIAADPGLGFKVWDQTFGAAGGTADTTTRNAFSADTALVTQPIIPINDAPGFTLAETLISADDNAGAITVDAFATNIAPGPGTATDEAGQALLFVVTVEGTTGTLSFDVAPAIDLASGALSFAAAPDTLGTATIRVLLRDDGTGTLPNANESAFVEFVIDISHINDEQGVAVDLGLTVEQGSAAVITGAMLETTDTDNSPAELVYTIVTGPSHGTLLVDGTPATLFTQEQINAGAVSYQNDGSTDPSDSFEFTVDDGQGEVSTGTFDIVIRSHAGDYNRDLSVDAGDFVLWRKTLDVTEVTPYSSADGDGDGMIGPGDYDVWRAHFGETFPLASGASGEGGVGSGEGESAGLAVVGQAVPDEGAVVGRQAQPDLLGMAFAESEEAPSTPSPRSLSFGGIFGQVISQAPKATGLFGPRAGAADRTLERHRDDALIGWLDSIPDNRRRDEGGVDSSASGTSEWEAMEDETALCDEVFESLAVAVLGAYKKSVVLGD
jgi:subtilisin-like proprotein convertase family protein